LRVCDPSPSPSIPFPLPLPTSHRRFDSGQLGFTRDSREESSPARVSREMAQAVEEWYRQMPIITRSYLTAAVVTTVGCTLEIISPYHLYLNPKLVVQHYEIWRLVTNFLYFRKMDLDFLFHMFFLARYCKLLEENSFRGRTADFFYMLLFGATVLTGIVLIGGMIPYISETFARILFLSNSLTFMMVYVWSKHNPFIHMSFLGLFTFTAAYLPWVSIFSFLSMYHNMTT
jgi:Derlin-2/3